MDHRYERLSVPAMWSCGVRIAAYQLAIAIARRLIADDEDAAAIDFDYSADQELRRPRLIS